jgi:hypothetical protein
MRASFKVSNRRRSQHGQTLAESGVALWVLTLTIILFLMLVASIGTVIFYKMKLALVTTQAAAYGSSIVIPSTVTWNHNQQVGFNMNALQVKTTQYTQNLLTQMGLTASTTGTAPVVTVTYQPIVADAIAVNVNVKLTSIPLFKGTVLPEFISMQDSATGISRYDQPPNLSCLVVPNTPAPLVTHIYMGGYGWAPGGATGDSGNDVMKLRPFASGPQTILMGIPSAGSGCPGTGPGFIGECYDSGVSPMTTLPNGSHSF